MNTKTYVIYALLCLGLLLAASYGGARAGLAANTLNGTWAYTGSLDSPRSSHTVTRLEDGRVLVTGGYDGESTLSSVEIYDTATGVWSDAASMREARRSHSATLLSSGKVLVVGGSGESSFPASAEIYDPVTNTWSYTSDSVRQRYAHRATLLPDGRVLVTGGWQPSGDGFTFRSEIDIYDPTSDSWTYAGHLFSRVGHTATLLPNGQVLLAAGYYNEPVDDAKLYDPTANRLVDTGTLQTKRIGHSATLLSNGQVLVAGGRDATTGESPGSTSAELYDPATGSWSYTGSMNVLRTGHSAARLQDGFVLVAGGYDFTSGAATIASTELYDPTTGIWSSTDDLNEPRAGRLVSLTGGTLLFPGGKSASDGSYSELSTVEVYQTDAISPTVVDTSPKAGAIGVRVGTEITATFSEAMDESTITTDTFTLESGPVPATVSYDVASRTATLVPDTDLEYGHAYTPTLSTDITDQAGNHLAEPYAWTFTTASQVEASFSGSPTSGVVPLNVEFANQSTGNYETSLWDLGDGVTSTLESPTHTYTTSGAYTVTLSVDGPGGADTEIKEGYITVEPFTVYLPLAIREG